MAQSGGGAWSTLDVKFDVHLTRAALSGLPSTSDNISDGTWLTLAARTRAPIGRFSPAGGRRAAGYYPQRIAWAIRSSSMIETLPFPASIWAM